MKKILLLLIFLCTISFSNTIGGFGDLKWGASREEAKKYLMETYKLKEYAVYEFDDYTQVNFENIKFLDVEMYDLVFYFNKNKQFSGWRAQTYTMRYDKRYLIDRYKKDYNLDEEKKSNDIISLTGFPESEAFLIQIYPDKVTFYIEDFNYSFPK